MRYPTFLLYNALGGVAWATLYGMLAYGLGRQFARYQVLITRFGLVLAVLGLAGLVLLVRFGRGPLERWALGPDGED